jgi:uncharacterized integral membrane protein (TIGR00698 family)
MTSINPSLPWANQVRALRRIAGGWLPTGLLAGLAVALVLGTAAAVLGHWVPVVGAPVIALLLAIGLRALLDRRLPSAAARLRPGTSFAGKYLLQVAIVLFGAGLSVVTVLRVGAASLPVMLGTLAVCLVAAWLLGRLLRIADPLRTLIGTGTGICGASAIAAVGPALAADATEMAYAVSTIVVYNVLAAVLFPAIGHVLTLGPRAFGLWAGTAVNDTSSVVATAYAYGASAGQYAVVVKLTRSLMIVPVVLVLIARQGRRTAAAGAPDSSAPRPPVWRLIPPFIAAFLIAAALNSVGVVPAGWHDALPHLAGFVTAVAMAGIGLGTSFGQLRRVGLRPLALGGLLSALTAGSSLALQALTGSLH